MGIGDWGLGIGSKENPLPGHQHQETDARRECGESKNTWSEHS